MECKKYMNIKKKIHSPEELRAVKKFSSPRTPLEWLELVRTGFRKAVFGRTMVVVLVSVSVGVSELEKLC